MKLRIRRFIEVARFVGGKRIEGSAETASKTALALRGRWVGTRTSDSLQTCPADFTFATVTSGLTQHLLYLPDTKKGKYYGCRFVEIGP
jgi:hypothetical protein